MFTEAEEKKIISRLDLKVGYSCINNCLFCVVADKRKFGDKSTDGIEEELRDAYREGKREVVFTGGECTARSDIFRIVSFAKKCGYLNIQIQTNGRNFASADFTKRMIIAGMNEFAPSIHGPNSKIHDFLTRRKGSWRQTTMGIYNVKRLGIRTLTNTVITKQNYRYLPKIGSLLLKLKVDSFQFAFVHIMGNALRYYKRIVPHISEVTPYLKEALDIGRKSGICARAEAVPVCLMRGYEKYLSEFYIPPIQVREVGWKIDNFSIVRKNEAKKKFQTCQGCRAFSFCEGPWREYPEIFGEEEFKPICN